MSALRDLPLHLQRRGALVYTEQSSQTLSANVRVLVGRTLARVEQATGNLEAAERRALEEAADTRAALEVEAVLAGVLLARGRTGEALAHAERLVRQLGTRSEGTELDALIRRVHAEALWAAGRAAEARQNLRQACAGLLARAASYDSDERARSSTTCPIIGECSRSRTHGATARAEGLARACGTWGFSGCTARTSFWPAADKGLGLRSHIVRTLADRVRGSGGPLEIGHDMTSVLLSQQSTEQTPRRSVLAACCCLVTISCASTPAVEGRATADAAITASDAQVLDGALGVIGYDAGLLEPIPPLPAPDPQAQCMPGRYDGMFKCLIDGLLPWQGKMSFSLVAKVSGGGEFQTLQIVPGTQITGNDDSFNGMFQAELQGTFDCPTGVLTGALTNGNYLFASVMNYELEGPLKGSYQTDLDGGGPGFDGTMGPLTSKTFAQVGPLGPSANCTWDAIRTGDAVDDAGVPDAGLADASR